MRGAGVVQATRNSWVRRMSVKDESMAPKSPSSKPLADLRVPEWENPLLSGQEWQIREQPRVYIPDPFTPVNMRHSFPDYVSGQAAYQKGNYPSAVRSTPPRSLDLSGLQAHTPSSAGPHGFVLSRQSSGIDPAPTPKRSAAMFDAALLRAGDGFVPLSQRASTPVVEPSSGDRSATEVAFSIVAEVGRTNTAGNDRDEMEARLMGASMHRSSPLDVFKKSSPPRMADGTSPTRVVSKAEPEPRRGAPPPPLLQGQLSFDPWRIEHAGTFPFRRVHLSI
jgi:hypothetical protein